MWIDESLCTKPCSVVISRISSQFKSAVPKQGPDTTKEKLVVPVLKQKKAQRTSFERSLLIQSGVTGQERKSSRLHGPKSRLRSRQTFNYSKNMPAPLNKDLSVLHADDRSKATHSNTFFKSSEWQKSTSSNPFKLRLKLNKDKHLFAKRKWSLQGNKPDDPPKCGKEESCLGPKISPQLQPEVDKVKIKEDLGKKQVTVHSTPGSKTFSSISKHPVKTSDKSPLSKLVISCKKAYRYHQPSFTKTTPINLSEEPKPETSKTPKRMTAYTVYTKLRENSIESINCKRYKKRKAIQNKVEKCRIRVRDSNAFSSKNDFSKDGSVESEIRSTLDSLLRDVVSAELDQLLNLEAPTPEMKDLLRKFCRQYGYNYDKDFSDLQNSVLKFKVTDSPCSPKRVKNRLKEPESVPAPAAPPPVPEPEQKSIEREAKIPSPPRSLKRRRKRKWNSSDDSDEQQCPEMLSAMMRSRSKDRRKRLSNQDDTPNAIFAAPKTPKRHRRCLLPTKAFIPTSVSEHDPILPIDGKMNSNSAVEPPTKDYSDDGEETDCGDNTISGHIYIPPLSSDNTSDEDRDGEVSKNCDPKFTSISDRINDEQAITDDDGLLSNPETSFSTNLEDELDTNKSSTAVDFWSSLSKSRSAPDLVNTEKHQNNIPHVNSFFRAFEDKSKTGDLLMTSSRGITLISADETIKTNDSRAESPIKTFSALSPDLDWDSDNLMICLDPEPSERENSVSEEPEGRSSTPEVPVREILYHTPKIALIDNHIPGFLKVDLNNTKLNHSQHVNNRPTCTSPTCEVESDDNEKERERDPRERDYKSIRVSPHPVEPSAKEAHSASHLASKHLRTPVQKVLPQVKSQSATLQNGRFHGQSQARQLGMTAREPKPQRSGKSTTAASDKPSRNTELSSLTNPVSNSESRSISLTNTSPLTISVTSPLVLQGTPTVFVPPLPTSVPSPVPIQALPNAKVPPLAVVPLISSPGTLQSVPNINVPPLSVSVTSGLTVPSSTPVNLISFSDSISNVSLPPLTVSITNPESNTTIQSKETIPTVPVSGVSASDLSQANRQNALEISILRSLLLDPPPEGAPSTELHNLILQKAKELDEVEQAQAGEFSLPVITNVISLNEEVIKQASKISENLKQISPVPKIQEQVQEPQHRRNTDSPEIVEEKLKSPANSSRPQHPGKIGMSLDDNVNDVLRNLQLEIKNLEKMAEDKKKEYFLIMYVRNFKRDTLRRLHEGLRIKGNVSPTSKKPSQCSPGTEPSHTHLKETCLVRPMVQTQPALLHSPKALKASDAKPSTPSDTQKGLAMLKLMTESQGKARSYSPEVRQSSGTSTPPVHSSLAALNKIESELRSGFRSYLSQTTNSKDLCPDKSPPAVSSSLSSLSGFSKYETPKIPAKASATVPSSLQNLPHPLTAISSSSVTAPQVSLSSLSAHQMAPESAIHNPSISNWKGTVSAYIQKTKACGAPKPPYTTASSMVPPSYPNTVKNLLKQSSPVTSNSGIGPVPSLLKDFPKPAENANSGRPHAASGLPQLNSSPYVDFYPFQGVSTPNNYMQSTPFWPSSIPNTKQPTSLASLQAARDLYLNSLAFGAWRTVKGNEGDGERFGDKAALDKLWYPASTASQARHYQAPESQDQAQNLVNHRPFMYGALRKCVVCKLADAQFICSGCGKDWYCSVTCQRQNWKVHSRSCVSSST